MQLLCYGCQHCSLRLRLSVLSCSAATPLHLQDYGSMNESTTCDEHDDEDHELLGLRAWNAGMARALWPSYSHVYNPSQAQPAAAPAAAAGVVAGSAISPGTSRGAEEAIARAGSSQRMVRAQSAGAAAAAPAAGLGSAALLGPGQPQQAQLRSRPWLGGSSIGSSSSSSRGYRRSAAALARSSSGRRRWSGSGSQDAAAQVLRSSVGSPASPAQGMQ
jgi:hypothetical protein